MATLITVGEAVQRTSYTHNHINWLARTGKIKAQKSGALWLIDLDDLLEYVRKMEELGPKKHDPTRPDL